MGNGVTTLNATDWNSYNGYYPITPCGYNYEIGNNTGLKNLTLIGMDNTVVSVPRWRGFNNTFGDIWTNLDGSYIVQNAVGDSYKQVFMTNNPEYFDDDRILVNVFDDIARLIDFRSDNLPQYKSIIRQKFKTEGKK